MTPTPTDSATVPHVVHGRPPPARRWRAHPHAVVALAVAVVTAGAPATARAHDTWFALRAAPRLPGSVVFTLGTGNQFPQHEFAVGVEHLQVRGCRQAGRELPLAALANSSTALLLNARAPAVGPLTCWAQLLPFEVMLEPDKIGLYLDEINAPAALRQTWAGMQARGVRWTERYVKNARIEVAGKGVPPSAASAAGTEATAAAQPVPMRMDVLLQGGLQARRAGEPLVFQVLRNGQPLPGFAIELRGQAAGQASWLHTDASGRVETTVTTAGRWVLRGTHLRLSTSERDVWESDFITLAFDVY